MRYRGLPRRLQALLWVAFVALIGIAFYGSLPAAVASIFHLADRSEEHTSELQSHVKSRMPSSA